jgi:hypothetical protein
LKPEFSNASASFKAANPHIFGEIDTAGQAVNFAPPEEQPQSKEEAKTEKILQNQLYSFLSSVGVTVIRSRMDKRSTINVGCPDLLFAVKGLPVAYETKAPGKKPNLEQIKMMEQMTKDGWKCFVIDNYDVGVETYRKLLLKHHLEVKNG